MEERIYQNILAKQKEAQEKEQDALKRTRTIIPHIKTNRDLTKINHAN